MERIVWSRFGDGAMAVRLLKDETDVIGRVRSDKLIEKSPFHAVIVEKNHVPFARRIGRGCLMPLAFVIANVMEKMSNRGAFLGAERGEECATSHAEGDGSPHG